MAYEFKLPDLGEGVVEGEVVRWLVKVGDKVEEDQPLVEVMTDKATVEIPSPIKGTIADCRGAEGDIIDVGDVLVVIQEVGGKPVEVDSDRKEAEKKKGKTSTQISSQKKKAAQGGLATPAVRKLALSKGIDLADVKGSGPGGRIIAEDLEQVQVKQFESTTQVYSSDYEAVPYRGLRRKIGAHLRLSKQSAVHYTYVEEADVTELVRLKTTLGAEALGRHLTYLPFILKAVVSGLKEYPYLNAELDEEQERVLLKKRYNIGIATATKEGLIVPVIRDVDRKSLIQLGEEVQTVVERARQGKAKIEDLRGSTFTVTSLGILGGLVATPVINYPEVAIMGVHKIAERPVVRDGQIVIRSMMNLSLSLDHRVVDGAVAADFVHHIIRLLSSPGLLLLQNS